MHSCVRPPAGFRVPGLGRAVRQAEHTGHRLQQAQSQDGQEEAAVRVQGRAQGRGGERQTMASTFEFLSREIQTSNSFQPCSCRRVNSSLRPSASGQNAWPSTAGSERGRTTPSGSLWAPGWTTTSRYLVVSVLVILVHTFVTKLQNHRGLGV